MAYAMGRTPEKPHQGPTETDLEQMEDTLLADMEEPVDVRRLTGEWEKGFKPSGKLKMASPPLKTKAILRPKQTPPNTSSTLAKTTLAPVKAKVRESKQQLTEQKPPSTSRASVEASTPPGETGGKYISRLTEAKAMMAKVRFQLNSSRNTSRAIIKEVMDATERLLQLVGESEAERRSDQKGKDSNETTKASEEEKSGNRVTNRPDVENRDDQIIAKIDENTRLLKENEKRTLEIRQMLEEQRETNGKVTYASIATVAKKPLTKSTANERKTLHSLVVTSQDVMETGEEVLDKVRKAVEAKEGWIKVEKVRKAKDSKIIMGCSTREDRDKIRQKIEKAGQRLVVEDMMNRDPLLVLKDVLIMHSDEEVVRALRNQNREVFHGLEDEDNRVKIKYKKKARNPHTSHIVVTVSPTIWGRATEQGRMRIDLQNVFVEDQSPLVQCSKCLGYGHGRRFCTAPADLCSHCGGPHFCKDCPDKVLGETPVCINCKRSGSEKTNHNAFNRECPVRRKWDSIARASTQYC